jgi:cytochrome b561
MNGVSRYHPLLVGLHWLLALLIFATLTVGFGLALTSNLNPAKLAVLRLHMIAGLLILGLMGVRYLVRIMTPRPPRATTGHPELDRIAPITHYGLYVLILLMAASGYMTAVAAGLPAILFNGSGAPLPRDFNVFTAFRAHSAIAILLVATISLHVSAALYHQFVRKDGLIKRMELGPPQSEGEPRVDQA